MSLDVYLTTSGEPTILPMAKIFVRENGSVVEITREDSDQRMGPGREPITVQEQSQETVYDANITHNLGKMADEAGIYEALWRPEEINPPITTARQLIPLLDSGLAKLQADPAHYKQFNAANGWGLYEHFVPFVERYLAACREYPDAIVDVSR